MTREYKPSALTFRWNKDLSITIYARGKKVHKTSRVDAKASATAFAEGWFGSHPHRTRWEFA